MAAVEQKETGSVELETDKNGHQIWLSVFKKQIKEKMKRYMDSQRDDPGPATGSHWGHTTSSKRDVNDDVITATKPRTEYITRLTSLRDSLISQEEANLAQALDRLRLHSIANKSQSQRLRMRPMDDFLSAPPLIHQRTSMVTTVERFRQMRTSRHQPVIFPLQGRQMLDLTSPRPASEVPISNFGNSTNRSTRSQSEYANNKPSHAKETVQSNLQRLIQRTSSIPNIGRKALKNQNGLEPKSKPLLNAKPSLQKVHGHLASPFLLSTHEDYDPDAPNGDFGVESLSPQAHGLGPALQEDTIDMGKLSQYYEKLISDIEMDGDEEEGEDGEMRRKRRIFNGNSKEGIENQKNKKFIHYKLKYRHSPYKSSLAKGQNGLHNLSDQDKRHYNSYNSIVSSSGKTIPFSDLPNVVPTNNRTSYACPSEFICDDVISDHAKSQLIFPEVQTSYRFQMGSGVSDNNSEVSKWYGNKSVYRQKSNHFEDDFAHSHSFVSKNSNNNNNNNNNNNKNGKMKIVVDMPNIIFNAASPENDSAPSDVLDSKGQGSNQTNSGMSLKKTVKQHELRQRELQNLLEDVKELNSWSEIGAKQCMPEGT